MSVPIRAHIKPDAPTTSRNPNVRTLHEPPEIWDLVHETRTEFDPRSAFVAHLTSVHPVVLAAIALIIGGGAVFGLIKLRGRSESAPAASSVQVGNRNTKTASSSPVTAPDSIVSPPNPQTTNTLASAGIAGSSVEPNSNVAVPTVMSGKRVVAKSSRQNPTSSGTTGSVTVAGTVNKDKAQESTTLGTKSDNEKRGNPTAPTVAKKESDKAPGPPLIAPAKGSPSPRGKVIQWP